MKVGFFLSVLATAALPGCSSLAKEKLRTDSSPENSKPDTPKRKAAPESLVGDYEIFRMVGGERYDNAKVPASFLALLRIKANSQYIIYSLREDVEGYWELKDGRLHLNPISGTAVKNAEHLVTLELEPSSDRSHLICVGPRAVRGKFEYVYDPEIFDKMTARFKIAFDELDAEEKLKKSKKQGTK